MEARGSRLSKIISIAIMFVIAILGIVIQILSMVQAEQEKDTRNVLFKEQKEAMVEMNSEFTNEVSEDEEPDEDVEPQIYVEEGIQNVEIFFVAPEVFYEDLFTTAAYGRILAEISNYFEGEGLSVKGALIVDEESIERHEKTVSFCAVAEEEPEIELYVIYERELDVFHFEIL